MGIDLDERGCQLCLEVPPVRDFLFRDLQGPVVMLELQPSIDYSKDDDVPRNVQIPVCGLNVELVLAVHRL